MTVGRYQLKGIMEETRLLLEHHEAGKWRKRPLRTTKGPSREQGEQLEVIGSESRSLFAAPSIAECRFGEDPEITRAFGISS